jgi:hypothetical protein
MFANPYRHSTSNCSKQTCRTIGKPPGKCEHNVIPTEWEPTHTKIHADVRFVGRIVNNRHWWGKYVLNVGKFIPSAQTSTEDYQDKYLIALRMEAGRTSETLVHSYQSTGRCNSQDSCVRTQSHENFRSYYFCSCILAMCAICGWELWKADVDIFR